MDPKKLLLIFVKNPVKGKVKTRLAQTIGEDRALIIYFYLLQYTQSISSDTACKRMVFYSDKIDDQDLWNNNLYEKHIQRGNDLGERMFNAFELGFNAEYKEIIIIGSDCLELTSPIIQDAFEALSNRDFVIGPAKDGGYYLLGMKKSSKELFDNIPWSTTTVFEQTIQKINKLKSSCFVLPTLSDIDEEKDLPSSIKILLKMENSNEIR